MLSTTSSMVGALKEIYGDAMNTSSKSYFLRHITDRPALNWLSALSNYKPPLPKVQMDIFNRLDHGIIQDVSRAVFGEIAVGLGLPDQNAYKMKEAIKDEIKSLTQETN